MQELRSSEYREHVVGGPLAADLVCFWSQTITRVDPSASHAVLPDDCVDIVLVADSVPVVAGPATVPIEARLPEGAWVVGARFRPGAAPSWLGAPASTMLNLDVELRELWGGEALRLVEDVAAAPSAHQRLAALRRHLTARLAGVQSSDPAIDAGVRALATPGPPSVRELARALGLGERQLLRCFKDRLGYGPKMLQRILRFQRLLHLAGAAPHRNGERTGPHAALAALALDAGYADQAHMNREVRAFSGATPLAVLDAHAGTLGLSDLFNTQDARAA